MRFCSSSLGKASSEGASINSLSYAGALFVREPHQLDAVRRKGPMAVLAEVALPA